MKTKRKIKWFEKPTVVNMTNKEIENEVRTQSDYFDVFPSAWYTDWHSPWVTEVEIHDDEGTTYRLVNCQLESF